MPRLVPCPLCGSNEFQKSKEDCGADVVRCSACRFLYVNPQPTSEELERLYSQEYYGTDAESASGSLRHRLPVFQRGVRIVGEIRTPGRILDVGCGNGDFLELARRAGWEAFGVDPSDHATGCARSRGLNVTCGTLETAGYASEFFDVVTMWDVLEHLGNPRRAAEESRRLLKAGGFLVVRVPNTNFQLLKAFIREGIFRTKRDSMQANLHLNHFSPTTLRRLLTSTGFEICREEVGVSEDVVYRPPLPLWFKKAYCSITEALRKTTSIQLGPTMVQCGRKISNDYKTTPQ